MNDNLEATSKPWGKYQVIDYGANFKVKRITVNKKSQLSLQKHQHRSEHWIIVAGEAEINLNNKMLILKENDRIFIPKGATHRIKNASKEELILIEVQFGSYLEEDDIERLEDDYGR